MEEEEEDGGFAGDLEWELSSEGIWFKVLKKTFLKND